MTTLLSLKDLLHQLSAGLHALPRATALYLFGSLITADADMYADIDLQIITADMALTRKHWPFFLDTIQPIQIAWPITPAPDNTAFTLLFHTSSAYNKLDIGLSSAHDPAAREAVTSMRCLWEQSPSLQQLTLPAWTAYLPVHGSVGHQIIEQLIAAVRYVKARKRQQPTTAWRFCRSQPDTLFHLLYERIHTWQHLAALSTWDYKDLDRQLGPDCYAQIMSHLDWSSPTRMDEQFAWFLMQIIGLYREKATHRGETLPDMLITTQLVWILPGAWC